MELVSNLNINEPVIYRRATLVTSDVSVVVAEMEDDFHHFRISLTHDGNVVTSIRGESIRFPWSTCGQEAAKKIEDLAGCRLESLYHQLAIESRYAQCTHLFDLVQLAVNHAVEPHCSRLYQSTVTLVPKRGPVQAVILLNGEPLLDWQIDNGAITSPTSYAGARIDALAGWVYSQKLPPELIEANLVLQRAVHVSYGKIYAWHSIEWASEQNLPPTCYTLQSDQASRAARVFDSVRDYTDAPERMLAGKNKV